ncbi:EamA family transporter [Larkinella arboricola]|uniref:Threonine/homoserine efflux transporter RhtA n=1 Tax=Larkinella arboricola TaxID=643671 RepID=A0A327WP82_LARAB|nr:EamA family transporter [Larkinella arboricola]RAJ92488.1 threonine/homoserine efflux transporter RhtA [Larkinella arboricola]
MNTVLLKKIQSPRLTLWMALASVYTLWGSTYLFIHFMTERMPPLYMASLRLSTAGLILYLYARISGLPAPTPKQWVSAGLIGVLLLTIANGCMSVALQYVPTSIAALLAATVPLFIILFNWISFGHIRPTNLSLAGLLVGLLGVSLLVQPTGVGVSSTTNTWLGIGLIMVANISWALGTLLSGKLSLPSQLISSAVQMLVGGGVLFLFSMLTENVTPTSIGDAPVKAIGSLIYLIIFGSIIGFSSFAWLARNASPQLVSTYAYVNPVVAMLLGWAFAGEALTSSSILAALIILTGVVLITLGRK